MNTNYSKWLFSGAIASVVASFLVLSATDKGDLYKHYRKTDDNKNIKETTAYLSAPQTAALSKIIIDDSEASEKFNGSFIVEWDDVQRVTITSSGKNDASTPDASKIMLKPQGDTLTVDMSQSFLGNRTYYRGKIVISLPTSIESFSIGKSRSLRIFSGQPELIGKKAPEKLHISNAGDLEISGDFKQVSIEQIQKSCVTCRYIFKQARFTQLSIKGRGVSVDLSKHAKMDSLQLQTDSDSKLHLEDISLLSRIRWSKEP